MRLLLYVLPFLLISCSASFHLKKAIKKDPNIISVKDTTVGVMTKVPVMTVDGIVNRDSIIYLDINCPEINTEVLKDGTLVRLMDHRKQMKKLRNENKESQREFRLEVSKLRQQNKTLRDSLKHSFKTQRVATRQDNRTDRQSKRQDKKTERVKSRKWSVRIIIAVVFYVLGLLTKKVISRFNIL